MEEWIINENGDNITIARTQKESMNDDDLYLGECENRLIDFYHIPPTESLYVLRIDVAQLGMQIPLLEYEILILYLKFFIQNWKYIFHWGLHFYIF